MKASITAARRSGIYTTNTEINYLKGGVIPYTLFAADYKITADQARRIQSGELEVRVKDADSFVFEDEAAEPPSPEPVYKFVSYDMYTRLDHKWVLGQWNHVPGDLSGLCNNAWLHAYADPVVGEFLVDSHLELPSDHRLFEGEALVGIRAPSKLGCKSLRLVEEMERTRPTYEQKKAFAILCAEQAIGNHAEHWHDAVGNWKETGKFHLKNERNELNHYEYCIVTSILAGADDEIEYSNAAIKSLDYAAKPIDAPALARQAMGLVGHKADPNK